MKRNLVLYSLALFALAELGYFTLPNAFAQSGMATRLPAKKSKATAKKSAAGDIDWIERAKDELASLNDKNSQAGGQPTELPTPATVVVVADAYASAIEKTALRFGISFEPYQPRGTGTFGVDETLQYDTLPGSLMGAVDLRWLPFSLNPQSRLLMGGFLGFGYSRQSLPFVTQTGFRYEDVALNSLRFEAGLALGYSIAKNWNLESRLGIGRQLLTQTSRSAEVVGNFDRTFLMGAVDLQYYVFPKVALMASVTKRSPLTNGTGSIGFDPLTVSGGVLVQVR